jgi:hypothetical protein
MFMLKPTSTEGLRAALPEDEARDWTTVWLK